MPVALMLATLTDRRGFGDDFLLERKFDGDEVTVVQIHPDASSMEAHMETIRERAQQRAAA